MKEKGKNVFKKSEIACVYLSMSLLFYIEIAVCMLHIDIGIEYITQILIMCTLLISCIPDMLINMDIAHISIMHHRMDLVEKVLIILLNDFYLYTGRAILVPIAVGTVLLNIISVCAVFRKMKGIDVASVIERLKAQEEKGMEKQLGYLIGNFVNIALFISMQDNIVEIILCGIFCLGVHFYLSEKMIKFLKEKRKVSGNRYRVILWGMQLVIMLVSTMQIPNLCYVLEGVYGMIIIDSTLQNKTALIKIN